MAGSSLDGLKIVELARVPGIRTPIRFSDAGLRIGRSSPLLRR